MARLNSNTDTKSNSKTNVEMHWPFFPTDFVVAKEYLKDKAGKGYYLKSIDQKGMKAVYQTGKPSKAYYYIAPFAQKDEDTTGKRLADLTGKGWVPVCKWSDLLILKATLGTESEEMQMPRDYAEDEKQYRKALMRSQTIPAFLFSAIFILISIAMAEEQPLLYAGNPLQKSIAIAFGLAMVFTVVILIQCGYNAAKSRGRQREGQEPRYASVERAISRTKWYLILAAIDVAVMLAFIFAGMMV